MVQKLVLIEPQHLRFLKLYCLMNDMSASFVIRGLLDELMAEESDLCKQYADVIFKGE